MTAPGGSVGRAFIDFHANTDDVEPELRRGLDQAAADADKMLDRIGTDWGAHLADSASEEIGRHGDDFADSMESSLAGKIISFKGAKFKIDRQNFLHDTETGEFVGRIITEEIVDSLNKAAAPGGPLSRVGEGFADAIGAGFNVSGRSPLIAALVPLFGAIAGLILGAVQAVNALLAVLTAVPALLTAIGFQVGILTLAFDGMGEAIKGAFDAKNATELHEAIKGLTPAGQDFVRSLLPIRDLFRELKTIAQQNFFSAFGDTLTRVTGALGPIFRGGGVADLARALGGMFRDLGLFFASPTFVKFVNELIPATVRWLGSFGPSFTELMTAIFMMATDSIPFLERLGKILNNAFGTFSEWIMEQSKSGNLTDWLDRMGTTLDKLVELFFQAIEFVATFMEELDKAGGNEIIDTFSDIFELFTELIKDDTFMRGLVNTVIFLTQAFAGLVIALMAAIAFFQILGDSLEAFFTWLTETAGPAIGEFFTETLPGFFTDLKDTTIDLWDSIIYYIETAWSGVVEFVKGIWNGFTGWFEDRRDDIVGFFTGLPDRLREIGQAIMQGLREGLQWGWDHTVGPILSWITNQIPDWKGPLEKDRQLLRPAGEAVMKGFSEGVMQGADHMRGMLGDLTQSISGINVRGSDGASMPILVNVNFHGELPSEQEAYKTGAAAGKGVADGFSSQVNQRDIALAVRMA